MEVDKSFLPNKEKMVVVVELCDLAKEGLEEKEFLPVAVNVLGK